MATLALQAAGSALGGPLGAFIGATIGNRIDHQIFGTRRPGPRLGDLSVQSSRYGHAIPRIFGTMRVAGSLVWATDLVESEAVTGAKGQADRVTYSYSASLAFVLSSRTAVRVDRIWADGKLLRGAEGDLKVGGTMRFWTGDERQGRDPLIASLEEDAPAYRGMAMVVFEDLELAEYGNRIPMMTFELVADEATPSLSMVVEEASLGAVRSDMSGGVQGYAVHGPNIRDALSPLSTLHDLRFRQVDGEVADAVPVHARSFDEASLGCSENGDSGGVQTRLTRSRTPLGSLPRTVDVDHYDPASDYQIGRASAQGDRAARVELEIDAPVVMASHEARALAERKVLALYRERERLELSVDPSGLDLRPGHRLSIDALEWLVDTVEIVGGAVRVEAKLAGSSMAIGAIESDSGTPSLSKDVVTAPTSIALFDLPDIGQGPLPRFVVAAANASEGWRSVPLGWSGAGQAGALASAGRETVLGFCEEALPVGASLVPDRSNSLVVMLVDAAQSLTSTDDDGLQAGENLAFLGDELIQYRDVASLGDGRYRLSHLLRGIRGTEWAIASHVPLEPFALVNDRRWVEIPLGRELIGTEISAWAEGLADENATPVSRTFAGEALKPPSPAHLAATHTAGGDLDIVWVARSRLSWMWLDGHDPGVGEVNMIFEVKLRQASNAVTRLTETTQLTVSAAELAQFTGGQVLIEVRSIGDSATSRPAAITTSI